MSDSILCPACGRQHRLTQEMVRERARCSCGERLDLPSLVTSATDRPTSPPSPSGREALDSKGEAEGRTLVEQVRQLALQLNQLHELGMLHGAPHEVALPRPADKPLAPVDRRPTIGVGHADVTPPEWRDLTPTMLAPQISEAQRQLNEAGAKGDVLRVDLFLLGAATVKLLTGASLAAYLRSPAVSGQLSVHVTAAIDSALGFNSEKRITRVAEFIALLDDDAIAHNGPSDSALTSETWSSNNALGSTSGAVGRRARDQENVTPDLPEQLGHFRLLGRIGRGGMGEVYRARDESLDREVAIKLLPRWLADDPDAVQRFRKEATAAAKAVHPNIVSIYSVGEQDGLHYYAMQLVEGQPLAQRMAETPPLEFSSAIRIVEDCLAGLEKAHSLGLVHRDIKPSNIILESPSGRAVLVDFGLVSTKNQATRLTATGAIVGTLDYISPEQARGVPVDHRADLYSLGIVFYELLAGALPFTSDSAPALLYKHVHEPAPPLREVAPHVLPSIESVVERLLAKDPAERFGDCAEVLTALRASRQPPDRPSAASSVEGLEELRCEAHQLETATAQLEGDVAIAKVERAIDNVATAPRSRSARVVLATGIVTIALLVAFALRGPIRAPADGSRDSSNSATAVVTTPDSTAGAAADTAADASADSGSNTKPDSAAPVASTTLRPASGQAIRGRFMASVKGELRLHVNGRQLTFNGATTLIQSAVRSEEVSLAPGDIIIVQFRSEWVNRSLRLAFVSSDKRQVLPFRRSHFRMVNRHASPGDITRENITSSKEVPREGLTDTKHQTRWAALKVPADNSEWIWGTKKKLWESMGCIVNTSAIVAVPHEIKLPEAFAWLQLAGGGRYVVALLPKQSQIVVYDSVEVREVGKIPAKPNVLFTAGRNSLVLLDPAERLLQRWSLPKLVREKIQPIEMSGAQTICMGWNSEGPVAVWAGGTAQLYDLETLEQIEVEGGFLGGRAEHGFAMRVSADGQTFSAVEFRLSSPPFRIVRFVDGLVERLQSPAYGYNERWCSPNADGSMFMIYRDHLFDGDMQQIPTNLSNSCFWLPTADPRFVLSAENTSNGETSRVWIHSAANQQVLHDAGPLESVAVSSMSPRWGYVSGQPRVVFLPELKRLIIVPIDNDRIVSRYLDLRNQLMAKPGLYILSVPPRQAQAGGPFAYQVDAVCGQGEIRFELQIAPEGVAIDDGGRITWNQPTSGTHTIVISANSPDGREVLHRFDLQVGE